MISLYNRGKGTNGEGSSSREGSGRVRERKAWGKITNTKDKYGNLLFYELHS